MADARVFHVCAECGKKFYVGTVDKWTYKIGYTYDDGTVDEKTRWFCKWSCMNKYRKARERVRNLDKELEDE